MSLETILKAELTKFAGCDAAAVIDLTHGVIIAHAGAIPEEPIRGMLGAAARDMVAGPNAQAIEEEFARMRGGPGSGGADFGRAISQVHFLVGKRWHFLQRLPARADKILAIVGASPNFGMIVAQLPGAAGRIASHCP